MHKKSTFKLYENELDALREAFENKKPGAAATGSEMDFPTFKNTKASIRHTLYQWKFEVGADDGVFLTSGFGFLQVTNLSHRARHMTGNIDSSGRAMYSHLTVCKLVRFLTSTEIGSTSVPYSFRKQQMQICL